MTTHRLLTGKAVDGALIGLQTRVARMGRQASVQGTPVHTRSTRMVLLALKTVTTTLASDWLRHFRDASAPERYR